MRIISFPSLFLLKNEYKKEDSLVFVSPKDTEENEYEYPKTINPTVVLLLICFVLKWIKEKDILKPNLDI